MLGAQFVFTVRALLVIVFAVAAIGKFGSRGRFDAFTASLAPLVPRTGRRRSVAAGIATVEVAIVVLLALPSTVTAGLALAVALLASFCVGIAHALRRGRVLSCRCFGSNGGALTRTHLVRNGLLLTAATAAALSPATGPPAPAAAFPALLVGGFLALLVVNWDQLAGLLTTRERA